MAKEKKTQWKSAIFYLVTNPVWPESLAVIETQRKKKAKVSIIFLASGLSIQNK